MCEVLTAAPKRGAALDTLEQLDQRPPETPKGPILKRAHALQKTKQNRARAKIFSVSLGKALYAHGTTLKRAYGRGLDCTSVIVQDSDGSEKTHYCGNRWCMVCNRIRTAKAIRAYMPAVEAWGDEAYFVTLTVQNCPRREIRTTVQAMQKAFTSCKRSIKRTRGLSFEAIRKLETNYSPSRGDYHPHFHVIVRGHEQAETLRAMWIDRAPSNVSAKAQDVRPVDSGAVKEMFKYFTKLLTGDGRGRKAVDAESLNAIFEQIKGLRTYQPVGFIIGDYSMNEDVIDPDGKLNTENVTKAFKRHGETVNWIWVQDYADWVDWETGECLSDYTPTEEWTELCRSIEGQLEGSNFPPIQAHVT